VTPAATLDRRTVPVVGGPLDAGLDRARSDEVLLARLRAGDDRALGQAFDLHGGMVHGLARRVVLDEQLARDITQDVFISLWERPDAVDLTRGSLRTYLGVVTHRRAVDAVRRSTRRARAEQASIDVRPHEEHVDDEVAGADARAWCRDLLFAALDQLPDDQRAAVVLAYFEGQPYREVARLLGIPEGTAQSRFRLGLARVRSLVGDDLRVER
jgi:RNA polymerase sigma-70 factor (ECF subfamily)